MANINFEIIEKIGVLSSSNRGWNKELNLVSWNGQDPKYDIRAWSADGEKMGKGVTLTSEELFSLKKILSEMELE